MLSERDRHMCSSKCLIFIWIVYLYHKLKFINVNVFSPRGPSPGRQRPCWRPPCFSSVSLSLMSLSLMSKLGHRNWSAAKHSYSFYFPFATFALQKVCPHSVSRCYRFHCNKREQISIHLLASCIHLSNSMACVGSRYNARSDWHYSFVYVHGQI